MVAIGWRVFGHEGAHGEAPLPGRGGFASGVELIGKTNGAVSKIEDCPKAFIVMTTDS
jgi:hypothetical protein